MTRGLMLVAALLACGDSRSNQESASAAAPAPKPVVVPASATMLVRLPDPIASGANKVGERIPAYIGHDVRDSTGAVGIPTGAILVMEIVAIEAPTAGGKGRLELKPVAVQYNGNEFPVRGRVGAIPSRVLNDILLVERATELTVTLDQAVNVLAPTPP